MSIILEQSANEHDLLAIHRDADAGLVATRQAYSVRRFNWRARSRVTCLWSDGRWYPARINWISSDGYNMQIRYREDGSIENTTTGKCRTR
jgi:hypothetical protein